MRTLFVLACVPVLGQQYMISTVAGNGIGGVSLYNPTSIAVDADGNLYVADWSGMIRKFWAGGGVTTVAGTGIPGYDGDGGQATSARIGKGINLALDSAGNLFFADADNNRIRRVDTLTGIITTVAGNGGERDSGDAGPAVDAGVARPTGVLIDRAGNLYISNWTKVRLVSASSGTIGTIAGGSTTSFAGDGGPASEALFWDPVISALGANGDIYLADYENSRIRKFAVRTGIVTTVAGSGSCQLSPPPFGVTVCQGGFGGDGGPATQAMLNYPEDMAVDERGNLYIADTLNHRIRWVNAETGVIYTIAGNGTDGFSGDGGPAASAAISTPTSIAVDRSGNVFFTDENNQCVRVLTPVDSSRNLSLDSPRDLFKTRRRR